MAYTAESGFLGFQSIWDWNESPVLNRLQEGSLGQPDLLGGTYE